MPQGHRLRAGEFEGVDRIAVAIAPREDDDPDADRHLAVPRAGGDGRRGAAEGLDAVGLDQRVRRSSAGKSLDDGQRRGLVGRLDGQLDPAPDANVVNALDPEVAEAALDRPALRIEDARAWA